MLMTGDQVLRNCPLSNVWAERTQTHSSLCESDDGKDGCENEHSKGRKGTIDRSFSLNSRSMKFTQVWERQLLQGKLDVVDRAFELKA